MGSSEAATGIGSRKWVVLLLLLVGVECWLTLGRGDYGTALQRWLLVGAFVFSLVSPIARFFNVQIERFRNPSARSRSIIAICIGFISTAYLLLTAHLQHRPFVLEFLDEQSYSIGMHMAARFRLWMPEHPTGDFFEAMQMLVHPVYASSYFPGTAMLFAPSVWLGTPWWVMSAIISGACVALTYRIVAELVDSVAGLLCAFILIGAGSFRLVSIMLLSQLPALLLSLLAIYAWLRWRQNHRFQWAIMMGICSGWCVITRPLDALALLAPIGLGILLELRNNRIELFRTLAVIVIAAIPFFAIQIAFDLGVTGSWHLTPFQLSQAMDYPQVSMGFHEFDPTVIPSSLLPQKQIHYQKVTVPALKQHRPQNILTDLASLFEYALPQSFLFFLFPVGVLAWGAKRWVMALGLLLCSFVYYLYVFKYQHYIVDALPALALCITCGIDQIRRTWSSIYEGVTFFLTTAVLVLCITSLPEMNRTMRDEWMNADELVNINEVLRTLPQKPAVVLFKFNSSQSSESEPVYNTDVAWPDDAPVIRAHDLGARNVEIFRYYAQHQPDRAFYLYDRGDGSLKFLGLAKDLGRAG